MVLDASWDTVNKSSMLPWKWPHSTHLHSSKHMADTYPLGNLYYGALAVLGGEVLGEDPILITFITLLISFIFILLYI